MAAKARKVRKEQRTITLVPATEPIASEIRQLLYIHREMTPEQRLNFLYQLAAFGLSEQPKRYRADIVRQIRADVMADSEAA